MDEAAEPELAPAEEEPAATPSAGLPDWIKAIAGPEPEAPAPGALEEPQAEELPDWLKTVAPSEPEPIPAPPRAEAPTPPAAPPPSSESAEPAESGDDRLARLAGRLAAGRRAKDQEIAQRLEKQRADREAAHREIAQRMEERRSRQVPGTGPLRPGTGMLKSKTGPLAPAEEAETAKQPAPPTPARAVKPASEKPAAEKPAVRTEPAPVPVASHLARARRARGKSPFAGQAHADVLAHGRQRLAEGDLEGAAAALNHLVQGGRKLPEIITELEAATSSNPGATVLYRTLGDAYMRANQLQRALDAYRQALAQM
jgi:hypothetical protein